jgi:hypothetical protein
LVEYCRGTRFGPPRLWEIKTTTMDAPILVQ